MAHLAKLKFSDKQRSQVKMTVEERLRHKLIDRLKEQKELAEADLKGEQLVRTREMAKENEFLPSMYANEETLGQVMDDKKREWEAARRELKVLAAEIENAIEAAEIERDKKEKITRLAKKEIENRLRQN